MINMKCASVWLPKESTVDMLYVVPVKMPRDGWNLEITFPAERKMEVVSPNSCFVRSKDGFTIWPLIPLHDCSDCTHKGTD
jgi:hypothetical protein